MSNPETDQYLLNLRKELTIGGLKAGRIEEVVDETKSHLTDMLEDSGPESEESCALLIKQFGPAKSLAKKIFEEYERSATSRRFWWPALLTCFASAIIPNLGRSHAFTALLLFVASLFVLGFLAHKPCIGQFITAFALISVIGALWAVPKKTPIGEYSPTEGAFPPKFLVENSELANFQSDRLAAIASEELDLDQQNRPDYVNRSYSGKRHDLEQITSDRKTLAYISWIKTQPWSTKFRINLEFMVPQVFGECAFAFLITNISGLFWVLIRDTRRLWRRIKYSRDPLST